MGEPWHGGEWVRWAVGAVGAAAVGAWRFLAGREARIKAEARVQAMAEAQASESRAEDSRISQRLDEIGKLAKRLADGQAAQALSFERHVGDTRASFARLETAMEAVHNDLASVEERRKRTSERVEKIESRGIEERREIWTALEELRRAKS